MIRGSSAFEFIIVPNHNPYLRWTDGKNGPLTVSNNKLLINIRTIHPSSISRTDFPKVWIPPRFYNEYSYETNLDGYRNLSGQLFQTPLDTLNNLLQTANKQKTTRLYSYSTTSASNQQYAKIYRVYLRVFEDSRSFFIDSSDIYPHELFQTPYQNKAAPDCDLLVEGQKISVHRSALTQNSEIFMKMFNAPMTEKVSNIVEIKNADYKTVEKIIKFLYRGRLRCNTIQEIIDVYAFAHQHMIYSICTGLSDRILKIKLLLANPNRLKWPNNKQLLETTSSEISFAIHEQAAQDFLEQVKTISTFKHYLSEICERVYEINPERTFDWPEPVLIRDED